MRVFFISQVDFAELGTASGVFSGCVPNVSIQYRNVKKQ